MHCGQPSGSRAGRCLDGDSKNGDTETSDWLNEVWQNLLLTSLRSTSPMLSLKPICFRASFKSAQPIQISLQPKYHMVQPVMAH